MSGKDDAQHIQVLTSTTALACPTPASTASATVAAGTIAQAFALTLAETLTTGPSPHAGGLIP
ncbi:MAG: hypothetical protein GX087_11190, partial [Desulfobulbaceae bacterium]|nr:hypothetical protein [Desulfobulbaceae bacterium]